MFLNSISVLICLVVIVSLNGCMFGSLGGLVLHSFPMKILHLVLRGQTTEQLYHDLIY
jgi:hypothetical protein